MSNCKAATTHQTRSQTTERCCGLSKREGKRNRAKQRETEGYEQTSKKSVPLKHVPLFVVWTQGHPFPEISREFWCLVFAVDFWGDFVVDLSGRFPWESEPEKNIDKKSIFFKGTFGPRSTQGDFCLEVWTVSCFSCIFFGSVSMARAPDISPKNMSCKQGRCMSYKSVVYADILSHPKKRPRRYVLDFPSPWILIALTRAPLQNLLERENIKDCNYLTTMPMHLPTKSMMLKGYWDNFGENSPPPRKSSLFHKGLLIDGPAIRCESRESIRRKKSS